MQLWLLTCAQNTVSHQFSTCFNQERDLHAGILVSRPSLNLLPVGIRLLTDPLLHSKLFAPDIWKYYLAGILKHCICFVLMVCRSCEMILDVLKVLLKIPWIVLLKEVPLNLPQSVTLNEI